MAYDNVTTWRLYAAEQSVRLGEPLADIAAAQALVRRAKRSRWWRENVIDTARIEVRQGGYEQAGGMTGSFSRPDSEHLPTRWLISIHPTHLNDLVVLHELAHCIAPRWVPSPKPRRKGQLHGHIQPRIHDAGFAGAMAELVRQFGTGAVHDELRDAYDHFDVPAMTLDEYREAVAASMIAEQDLVSYEAEWAEYLEQHPMSDPPPGGWKIPKWGWGDALLRSRRQAGRMGMDRLATTISKVERCTRTDIRRIEESEHFPEDMRDRRLAMCMAVVFGLDPIYMRHQLGLVRWDCGVELDELRTLNPGWVENVETMNRQLEERPPRWVVAGER